MAPVMRIGGVFLAGVLLLAGAPAQAVGLGSIEVQSALNEPFRARIPVTPGGVENVAELQVDLAPFEIWERAGIEYNARLQSFRFRIEPNGLGELPTVVITSLEPINEPFLDLIVRLRSPDGQVIRDYAVLLDPPGFTPPVAPAATSSVAPAKAPQQRQKAETTVAPQSAPAPGRSAPAQTAEPTPRSTPADYGPVRPGQTLSEIAEVLHQGTPASLEQMAVALYRDNPRAFSRDNMNGLRVGAVLQVPPSREAAAIPQEAAVAAIAGHAERWRQAAEERRARRKPKPTPSVTAEAAEPPKEQPEAALRIVRPGDAARRTGVTPPSTSELKQRLAEVQAQNEQLAHDNRALLEQLEILEQRLVLLTEQVLAMPQKQPTEPVAGPTPAMAKAPAPRPALEQLGDVPLARVGGNAQTAPAPWWSEPVFWGSALMLLVLAGGGFYLFRRRQADPLQL